MYTFVGECDQRRTTENFTRSSYVFQTQRHSRFVSHIWGGRGILIPFPPDRWRADSGGLGCFPSILSPTHTSWRRNVISKIILRRLTPSALWASLLSKTGLENIAECNVNFTVSPPILHFQCLPLPLDSTFTPDRVFCVALVLINKSTTLKRDSISLGSTSAFYYYYVSN